MSAPESKVEWELPRLREAYQIPALAQKPDGDLWAVKFYPFTESGADPIFAAVGNNNIFICRPPVPEENKTTEIILSVVDHDTDVNHFACAWTKDLDSGVPLLCVAGITGTIKIINALTGDLQRCLIGHGGGINDLQTSPSNPQILASCSDDSSVRIWSLDPAHSKHPCAAILAGDGHHEIVLTLSFHESGRYLLSGGVDHVVNLWVLPEFPDANTGTYRPTKIHYPHFSTSEVHAAIVDCVLFYDDLILSKSDSEQSIVLWSITGFSSSNPPPPPLSAPTTHDPASDTRSAFTSSASLTSSSRTDLNSSTNSVSKAETKPEHLYNRHLQLSAVNASVMFQRFSLYPGSSTKNPVLAFSPSSSKVFFWDLTRLSGYYDYVTTVDQVEKGAHGEKGRPTEIPKRPPFLVPFRHRNRGSMLSAVSRVRETSPTDSSSSHHTGTENTHAFHSGGNSHPTASINTHGLSGRDLAKSKENWAKRYNIGNEWTNIAPHREEAVKTLDFVGRQIAWSNGGEWCVVVGSEGAMAIFERWAK